MARLLLRQFYRVPHHVSQRHAIDAVPCDITQRLVVNVRLMGRACGFDMALLVERLVFAVGEVALVGFTGKVRKRKSRGFSTTRGRLYPVQCDDNSSSPGTRRIPQYSLLLYALQRVWKNWRRACKRSSISCRLGLESFHVYLVCVTCERLA